ncbi:Manganese-dependent protein-tyrosine phosphatase [Thioalkalivibrio nitratireducens DSM 14787]|uniref:protein-tyrosine-phosphatase n=1 Tax=Thioalkalivibrio nitratireducens (strain DSM 14787 / UNIQEM 213 / ALEN2) TaxID=1255043 RepID=L0DVK9_THIND|nr:CpsB/CapC family capsule biosynthesis tyrosine phosphatase [Thioalkalivibrio nitratireducens]AGA33052.1 Manganese-dependent protein-tyrosine phosphatase [Thioalkalivibrio nitratireducens DSM 14787]
MVNPQNDPLEFIAVPATGMVDVHAHLLPGIDDGAKDLQQALNMARLAVADGTRALVVTPHHLNGVYRNPADSVRGHCTSLRAALRSEGLDLVIFPGSECHLVPELPTALAEGSAMTVADRGHAVLVELPVHNVPFGATGILEDLLAMGLQPVIAHPERNAEVAGNPDILEEWVSMGCLGQITAQSCSGRFGPRVQQAAEHMVRQGLVQIVASDAHRDSRRVPELSQGRAPIERWVGSEAARLMAEDFPRALVAGDAVDTRRLDDARRPPRAARIRGWLGRLRA